ncbi:hypothetical protein M0R72_19485 [Candidatus Pacearchaeota archaeon]|jgi:hypothetical protein|nr:hypothetical protein [Candidatus Pacearchaeota archaeon]
MKTIEPRQEALDALFEEIFAEEIEDAKEPRSTSEPAKNNMSDKAIIQKALLAKDGRKFEDLWKGSLLGYTDKNGKPDPSAADMALMNKLAFWTGGNATQMERLFSASMLGKRDKWIDRADYRDRTIKNALKNAKEFYKPPREGPKLKTVSADSAPFSIGVTKEGIVAQLVETKPKDGEPPGLTLAWVSDCPVYIATETIADDETEFTFKGKGAKDNREVCFKQSARDMAVDEKFEAALINAFGAKNRVGKLTFDIVQRITLNTKKMKRIAVPRWEGKIPLVPGVELMENVEYKLADQIPACVYDGDLKKALKVLKCLMKVHKYAPLLVATILGAPIIAKEHKTKRFGFGIWGGTGTFKTSTATAAMCIYGVNYIDDPKLKSGKSGSTAVGAMEIFAAAGILPQIFDNVKAADPKDAINYVSIIQGILEGEEKARGKKDGGLRKGREFLTTPIITGEVKPQEAATSARVLNTNWVAVDGKLLREVQENATLLPVIGYNWLNFLGTTEQEFAPGFGDYQSKLMTDFIKKEYVNPGRLATICTLLKSVWALLEVSPIGAIFHEMEKEFAKALEEAAREQGETTSEETESARFMAGLNELLIGNPGLFVSKEGKKTVLGNVIGKWMDNGICVLPLQTLNELSKIKTFTQTPTVESMTMALDRENLLIHDAAGNAKYQMRINNGKTRGWYIKMDVVPMSNQTVPNDGYRKTISEEPCTSVPDVPSENEREGKKDETKKSKVKYDEKLGTTGTDIDNELVDSDNSVPNSVPSVPKTGGLYQDEKQKFGKNEMETPISESNLIRNAAILEHGLNGWIDARNVANKLKIPLVNVVNYLERTHDKTENEFGYRQKRQV